jgi:hypothetical protein
MKLYFDTLWTTFPLPGSLTKNGYDPAKHYRWCPSLQDGSQKTRARQTTAVRQNTMVHPGYQRMKLGRTITKKLNKTADEGGAATIVRARHRAASLFRKTIYKVWRDLKKQFFAMKR